MNVKATQSGCAEHARTFASGLRRIKEIGQVGPKEIHILRIDIPMIRHRSLSPDLRGEKNRDQENQTKRAEKSHVTLHSGPFHRATQPPFEQVLLQDLSICSPCYSSLRMTS